MLEVREAVSGGGGGAEGTARFTQAEDGMRERAHKLCRDYLHGAWLHIKPSDMIFRKVSGGLSNLLYYCGLPEGAAPAGQEPSRLLLRLYGRANEDAAMETLVTESVIFALLSESQRGPRLYGVFPGGRLEEYIPARPLLTKELSEPQLIQMIAEKMAQIHQMDVPINKRPKWLWQTMNKWLNSINEVVSQGGHSPDQESMFQRIRELNLASELSWLKDYLTAVDSPVVFCHNDLQEGNILLLNTKTTDNCKSKIVVIDYEYCSYNYRGFDIANHFCEWIYDYTNEDPPYFWEHFTNANPSRQEEFVGCYLERLKENPNYKWNAKDTIENVLKEAQAFTLASHFFWGLWSILNSTGSTITFDYSGYGEARLRAYYQHKEKVMEI